VAILDSKWIIGDAKEFAASPSRGRGALQNRLSDRDARGNLILALAGERRGRDPQEELQLLRSQMERGGRNAKIEIRSSGRHWRTVEVRISILDFRVLFIVSHFGQRQRVHPPPPSLALIGRELSWSYCEVISSQLLVFSHQFSILAVP